jgi:hypothetical protein
VALSILPIEQSTLAYGSADGGVVVHTENSRLNDYMQAAGQKMNLKVSIILLLSSPSALQSSLLTSASRDTWAAAKTALTRR